MNGLEHRAFLAQAYALINPLQVGAEHYADLDAVRLLPKGMERHAHMMPLVVELKLLSEDRRLALLERAEQWSRTNDMPLFSALLSGGDKTRVLPHLQRHMVVSRRDMGRAWLRYHDPRVFRHLRWLLSAEQMAALMGPLETWTWYDQLQAQWHTHARPPAESVLSRLLLTQEQWADLEHLEALNQCLRELAEDGTEADDAAASAIRDGLRQARQYGLSDSDDIRLFALQYQQHGPQWHRQGSILQCIEKVKGQRGTYVSAFAELGSLTNGGAGSVSNAEQTHQRDW